MKLRRFLFCTTFLVTAARASAQGGPPMVTDDPWTPQPSHWEMNGGWSVEKGAGSSTHELPIADVNYGWGNHIQLKLEVPLVVQSDQYVSHAALGNFSAGVKWRFVDNLAGFAASTYPQVQIPRSTSARRAVDASTRWALLLPVEMTHSIGRIDVDVELGRWLATAPEDVTIAGLAVGFTPREGLELIGECNAEGRRIQSPESVLCGLGVRADLTEHTALMGAFEPYVGGSDPTRPRFRTFLGVQAHVRGGGLWHTRRHHTS